MATGPRIVAAGYFGCGNLGDEAVLAGLMHGLAATDIDVTVLSGNPEATARAYPVEVASRTRFPEIKAALKGADALVLAGGSLLQDVTSLRSLFYYLYLLHLGRKITGKVALTGQGIGPLRRGLSRRAARTVLNRANFVAVRDADSAELLKKIGVKSRVELTADMAWMMPPDEVGAQRLLTSAQIAGDKPLVGLAPRPWGTHSNEAMAEIYVRLIEHLVRAGYLPVGIVMDQHVDTPLWRAIQESVTNLPVIDQVETPGQMLGLIARMDALVAMRLHALIFAAKSGVPTLPVTYDPKVTSTAKAVGLPNAIPVDDLSPMKLVAGWSGFERSRETTRQTLQANRAAHEAAAERNIRLVRELLDH